MATASAIKDGLITNLSAASVFGSGNVSTNYAVMESAGSSCGVINLTGYENEALTFGNNRGAMYEFLVQAWVRDFGDHVTAMNNVYEVFDKVKSSLKSDDTVQGTAHEIGPVTAERDPNVAFEISGQTWLPIDIFVGIRALDD